MRISDKSFDMAYIREKASWWAILTDVLRDEETFKLFNSEIMPERLEDTDFIDYLPVSEIIRITRVLM